MIPPVSYNRSHAAVFSQTHILTRNISRRFEALSHCCFFGRLFFAVSRPCVVVEITPATVLSLYSSFSNSFFENSTGCGVISFVVRFVLQCCVVVEFHSSHSCSSSSFSLLPPPTPTPGHTFVFFLFSRNMDEAAIQLQIQQAVAAAMAAAAAAAPPVPVAHVAVKLPTFWQ